MADQDVWAQAAKIAGSPQSQSAATPSGNRDVWSKAAAIAKGGANPAAQPASTDPGFQLAPNHVPQALQANTNAPAIGDMPAMSIPNGPANGSNPYADAALKASRPGLDSKLGATSDVLRAAGSAVAPIAIAGGAIMAPAATAAGLGLGAVGQGAMESGLKDLGVGPGASALGGDIAGGITGGLAAPALSEGITKAASALPDAVSGFFKVNRGIAAIKAWSPTPTEYGFENRIEDTTDRIQDAYDKPIKTNTQAIDATQKALDRHKDAYNSFLDTAAKRGQTVNGDIIVKATADAIPSTLRAENPEMADAIIGKAKAAYGGRQLPVKLVESLREEKTADLRSLYNGSDASQIAAKNGTSDVGILKAQRDAIADHLYNAIDQDNDGAGPRSIQLQRSDMIDILDAAKRRSNVAIGSKPVSGLAGLVELAPNTIKAIMNPAGGVGFVKNPTIVNPGTLFKGAVDPWVAKVFKGAGKPSPIPTPSSPSVAGLLEPGAIRMTTPDTSGPTQSEPQRNPGFWNPLLKNKTPLLGSSKANPSDPLGSSSGDAMNLIPVKNKDGKTEYVPRWMADKPQ